MNMKLIDPESVIHVLEKKPVHTEVVITGRNAPEEILKVADYITDMGLKRHPYMKQIYARKGIEF
jgi:cob(I)alamin adenosyltransferase